MQPEASEKDVGEKLATMEPVHEIQPGETYQIDSSDYDSEEERDNLGEDEYDALVDEAENSFAEEQVKEMIRDLKEKGIINFLRAYLAMGENGEMASLRKLLLGFGIIPPAPLRHPSMTNASLLPFTKIALSRILRRREKLPQYNTLEDAIELLRKSKNIIVLSGAGISTSCGIPDFRSANGLYANLQAEGKFDLDDPQQMFDIRYFVEHPEVFYSFAKSIYPSNFVPSPCHRWIKLLEDRNVLLRNYTQNIDTLESLAGVNKVLQCHGSFKTASCLRCKTRVPGPNIEPYIMASQIPYCGICRQARDAEIEMAKGMKEARRKEKGKGKAKDWGGSGSDEEVDEWGGGLPGIMKPDITFFGQALESEFDECLYQDREKVDLLVIIGTSLKVAPVSEVLTHIPHSVPQIFINLTPVHHVRPDISLLGDADSIVSFLSRELGWTIPPPAAVVSSPRDTSRSPTDGVKMVDDLVPTVKIPPEEARWQSFVGDLSHVHIMSSIHDEEAETNGTNDHDAPSASSMGDITPQSDRISVEELKPLASQLVPEEDDGYESDDERPSKRGRMNHL